MWLSFKQCSSDESLSDRALFDYHVRLMACEIAGIGHSLDQQIDCVDDNFGRRRRTSVSRQSDGAAVEPAEALQELGGAAAIVATAASGTSMSPLIAGLAPRGWSSSASPMTQLR